MLTKRPKSWLLGRFQKGHKVTTEEVAKKLGISRQAAHRYLVEMIQKGTVIRLGRRRGAYYILNDPKILKTLSPIYRFSRHFGRLGLEEDKVLAAIEEQSCLNPLSESAKKIIRYAFTEMLNNAIEHSQSDKIQVLFEANDEMAWFSVIDQGVGIYNNICQKKRLAGKMEAIQDLMKGKLTTAPRGHSGEGIFFTSKIADRFEIDSSGKLLAFDNNLEDIFLKDTRQRKGTKVFFQIESNAKKDITDIFRQYSSGEYAFDKTAITVKLFAQGVEYVSRSQARRLLVGLDKFREVVLDFKRIETIGQGFADEVFRVFQNNYPAVCIKSINANENVSFMIARSTS